MFKQLRIGDWLVYPDNNKLCFNDKDYFIEPLAMDVLVYLARHSQQVVSREQLIGDVWNGRIVGDHAVYRIINRLRQTLAKDATQEYIKTIRKKGYQLVCEVDSESLTDKSIDLPSTDSTSAAQQSVETNAESDELAVGVEPFDTTDKARMLKKRSRWRQGLRWSLLSLAVVIVVVVGAKLYFYSSMTEYHQSTSLITLGGTIRDPSFSPDGQFIAFSYRESVRDDWDIYVESLVDGRLYQISDDITDELSPAWAPDGSRVAVLRYDNKRCMIDVIAIPLPSPQEKSRANLLTECSGVLQHNDITWGGEGKYLYYTSASSKFPPCRFFV